MNTLKSAFVTLGVVALGWIGVLLVIQLEQVVGVSRFTSPIVLALGIFILITGVFVRGWAAYMFYKRKLMVVALKPQASLVIQGPFQFSRNPLILGIVTIVLGLALIFGSWGGIILSLLVFLFWDIWIRKIEEKELERVFGEEYRRYKKTVPRWVGFQSKHS